MINNFYILVDTKLKITLEYITELPQNWRNICGLPGLSDEEISDLTWDMVGITLDGLILNLVQ